MTHKGKCKLCQSSWCCWTCTRPPDSLVPCAPCQPPCSSAGLRPLPAEATTRNLPPGVRALELAHPLPALGKEDCADFFKCQTIRKKAGWRLLPTTEKLPTQGRELEAQTLFAQIQHICLVCKGWKRNQPCRNMRFVKLRLVLRTLSQKKKKMCPQIFKNCLKMTIQTDHVQILTPPPAGMRGDGTRSQGLSRCFSTALLIRALPEPLAGCVPKSHHHPFGLTLLHGCAPSSPGCPVLVLPLPPGPTVRAERLQLPRAPSGLRNNRALCCSPVQEE